MNPMYSTNENTSHFTSDQGNTHEMALCPTGLAKMTTDPALISADQGTFTPVRGSLSSRSAASLKAESSVNILNVHTADLDTPRLYRGKHTMYPKKCSATENRSRKRAGIQSTGSESSSRSKDREACGSRGR